MPPTANPLYSQIGSAPVQRLVSPDIALQGVTKTLGYTIFLRIRIPWVYVFHAVLGERLRSACVKGRSALWLPEFSTASFGIVRLLWRPCFYRDAANVHEKRKARQGHQTLQALL